MINHTKNRLTTLQSSCVTHESYLLKVGVLSSTLFIAAVAVSCDKFSYSQHWQFGKRRSSQTDGLGDEPRKESILNLPDEIIM